MSHYHVIEGPKHSLLSRSHMFVAVGAVVVTLVGLPAFTTMTVTVDGEEQWVERGFVAADLVDEGYAGEPAGDLIALNGDVVAEGGGEAPRIVRDGEVLSGDDRVHPGDVLESEPGHDVVETQVASSSATPIQVEYRGEGPMEHVSSEGSEGLEVRAVGKVSGIVTPLGEQRPGEPMIVERTYPKKGDKVVALTFDDGPWPGQTEKVLEILEDEGVKATFFVLGLQVERHPGLAERIAEEGHQVGSHGYAHRYLTSNNENLAMWEVRKAGSRIAQATGEYPTWFRAPGGVLSDAARDQVEAQNLRIVRWDVDPQDWRQERASRIYQETVDEVRPGSVVLLHDGGGDRVNTIKALPWIIHELQRQGYTFVTLDEIGSASRS